jgi:hypothetical protein
MSNANALLAQQQAYGSADFSEFKRIRRTYFDRTIVTGAGVSELSFFSTPRGGVDPNLTTKTKTAEDTNMTQARQFGGRFFTLHEIRCDVRPVARSRQHATIIADVNVLHGNWVAIVEPLINFMTMGVLRFTIGDKDYFEIDQPFINAPSGLAECGHRSVPTDVLQNQLVTMPQNARPYVLPAPQMIEPDQFFDCKIEFPNGNTPSTASLVSGVELTLITTIMLCGYEDRPAQ